MATRQLFSTWNVCFFASCKKGETELCSVQTSTFLCTCLCFDSSYKKRLIEDISIMQWCDSRQERVVLFGCWSWLLRCRFWKFPFLIVFYRLRVSLWNPLLIRAAYLRFEAVVLMVTNGLKKYLCKTYPFLNSNKQPYKYWRLLHNDENCSNTAKFAAVNVS